MRVTLSVIEGPNAGASYSFDQHDTFLVGRSPDAHFHLPEKDMYFSRMHFMVEVNPPLCRLMDMGSHNHTYLNGVMTQTADLKDGDLIKAGHTVLRVSIETPATQAEPAQTWTIQTARPVDTPPVGPVPATVRSAASTGKIPAAFPAIPDYEILAELGRGGMGVVYQARHLHDGAMTALKVVLPVVKPNERDLQRFLREAGILRQLSHPNIVAFRDLGEAHGLLYFAMDHVAGTDAARLLRDHGALPVPRAVNLACQLLDGLAYAHANGFVHRDIKPANLLLNNEGGRETLKLADFGLARAYQASQPSGLTVAGSVGGTALFMPPEQVLNFRNVQPAADQYAAAASLYNLLTGQFMYEYNGSIQELLKRVLLSDPVPIRTRRPDVPLAVADAIHKALCAGRSSATPTSRCCGRCWRRLRVREGSAHFNGLVSGGVHPRRLSAGMNPAARHDFSLHRTRPRPPRHPCDQQKRRRQRHGREPQLRVRRQIVSAGSRPPAR